MVIQRQVIEYDVDGVAYKSLAAWDDVTPGPRPGILIAPTFMGRTAAEDEKAAALAALGYVGFALDLYGIDVRPADPDQAAAAMAPLNDDRRLIIARMSAALETIRTLDRVQNGQIGAIGFCLGGKCVLDLARSGADIKGVVSFHGILDAPPFALTQPIVAKLLVLHGWDDPLAPPDAVAALAAELTSKAKDWQIHAYGHTEHGFTNRKRPQMYREVADRRSWQSMLNFFAELFG